MLEKLFDAIDTKDAARFAAFFTEHGVFRFGNLPEQKGRNAIMVFVSGFFESIDGLTHRVDESWEISNRLVCHGEVTYLRKDGRQLSVPFSNILRVSRGEGIIAYQVFVDISAL